MLKLASTLNPDFKSPKICGGYLRDVILQVTPSDCDVVFDGYMKDQPGVLECVKEAENKLGMDPYPNWKFENFNASGVSGDMFEDTIGFYSNHTDYLTMMLCDVNSKIQFGSDLTIRCLTDRVYYIRYQGLLLWVGLRDRSYFRALCGHACRALYLCHKLSLRPTNETVTLFLRFDENFEKLTDSEKTSLHNYWNKKTANLKKNRRNFANLQHKKSKITHLRDIFYTWKKLYLTK